MRTKETFLRKWMWSRAVSSAEWNRDVIMSSECLVLIVFSIFYPQYWLPLSWLSLRCLNTLQKVFVTKRIPFCPQQGCKRSVVPRIICVHFPLVWSGQLCLKTIAHWGRVILRISFTDKLRITKDGITSSSLIEIKGTFAQIWSCVWKNTWNF